MCFGESTLTINISSRVEMREGIVSDSCVKSILNTL